MAKTERAHDLALRTLAAYVTSTNERIGTLNGRGTRYSGQFDWPVNPASITIRSSGGGSVATEVTLKYAATRSMRVPRSPMRPCAPGSLGHAHAATVKAALIPRSACTSSGIPDWKPHWLRAKRGG